MIKTEKVSRWLGAVSNGGLVRQLIDPLIQSAAQLLDVQQLSPAPCGYLAVHPAQAALLDDQVPGGLQEVGAEVALLDVVVFVSAVSGPGSGPGWGVNNTVVIGVVPLKSGQRS